MSPKRQLQRHALEKMGRRRRKEDKTTRIPTVEPLHRNLDIPSAPLMPRTILDQMITMINPSTAARRRGFQDNHRTGLSVCQGFQSALVSD